MEEENLCSSPPDVTVTAVQLPQQALWTSTDHRRTNGGEEAIVCGAIEVQIDWAHEADQLSLEAGPGTPEEPGPGTAEEAGLETPEEAGPDTPEEAGLETPKEAGLETPEEAGPDTPEEAGLETPKEAGLETPEEVGLETPEEAGLETPEEGGLEAPEEAGLETPEELGLENPEHAGLETPEEAGLETPEEAGLETPEEVGLETPEEGGLEAPEKAGLETPEEAGPDSPEEAGLETPKEAGLETPEEVGLETPEDAGLETPEEAGLETPEDAGLETPEDAGLETPEELGLETPEEAGLETPEEAGLETPEDAGLETPEELGLETPEEAGLETPEEAAQWEQTVWQLTCTGAPLSFATVRWDVPDPSAATPSLVTDIGSANGPIPGGVTSLDRTSPWPQRSQGVNADLFIRQGRGEDDGFDYLALDSNPELTGNASEPCGTADVQEPPTQEREDPTHKLIESNNGVPLRAVLEEEEVPSANSRPVTVNSLHLLDVTAVSQGEADSFVDLKPQEEPGQPCCVLLTGPSDSEEEQTSARGVEDEGEEQEQINVSCTEESKEAKFAICLSYVEFSGELSQTEDARETVNSDKPTDRPDIGSHEEPGMCVEVDRKADPERSEAADGVEESSARAAGHSDRRENSPEATALIEGSEEGETTLRRAELPPQARQGASERLEMAEEPKTGESQATQHLSAEPGVAREAADEAGGGEEGSAQPVAAREERAEPPEGAAPLMNGDAVNGEMARRLAERLRGLDGIQRADVVKHLDKDNDFSRAVGEEYLKLFDFTGQTLDHGLRSFLKVVVLIGETQERERVLQHFACRFHHCNPDSFTSSESVLALTCALMLLNTDLHGQNVGKSMSSAKFVSNLDGMNEGENFSKDLLKSLYNSIKSEPLQWAVDEEELKSSVLVDEDAAEDAPLRSKSNPFQDVPHDKTASVVKQGFLQRKLHADIDGKRTPWGKRGWKTFYGVVRGMVLYLQKDDYRRDQPIDEEVVSLHHSLAEQAADYTKKPHVFRLQTADWRVLLFQASSKLEMHSWISRINLVSALHSSPPFPAAVGSQRRFCRPILPSSQSGHTPERQLQSYAGTLKSFKDDLSYLQENLPEGKRAKAKELEEHRVRAEYLHHEMCRYEIYIQGLEAWRSVTKAVGSAPSVADLNRFDKAVCAFSPEEEEEEDEGRLKKSHSSPSLELEIAPPALIKVRRNISERRTYRKTIIPRWNKEV